MERIKEINKLKRTILAHHVLYENNELRIYPISQQELWEEGFDDGSKNYLGAKWGKYIRAPQVFFKILEMKNDVLVPLKVVAKVRFGLKTGANEFFYLTEEDIIQKGIEKSFRMHKDLAGKWHPNKVIVSPREGKNVVLTHDVLNRHLISIDKEKAKLRRKKVLSYIKNGEAKGYHNRQTCKSRKMWYSINRRKPWPLLHPMIHNDRQAVFLNRDRVQVDHNLFEIKPKPGHPLIPLLCFLLSTVSILIKEFTGRSNLGQGALKTEGIDIGRLLVPRHYYGKVKHLILELVKKYPDGPLNSIFDDLGTSNANKVSFEKILPARRELDRIIMGEILGLTDEEQLEVYRAVVDVIKSRLDRAKSWGKKKKLIEGVDIDSLKSTIVNHVKEEDK